MSVAETAGAQIGETLRGCYRRLRALLLPQRPPSRWTVLAFLAAAPIGNYYVYDIPAALTRQLAASFGASKANWQYAVAASYAAYALPNIFAPFVSAGLAERAGTHRALLALTTASAIAAALFAAGVHACNMPLALIARFLLGAAGDSINVAQARIACNWFEGPELALAFGIMLSVARLGSVINDILSPIVASSPTPGFYKSPDEDHLGTSIACWSGAVICTISALSALLVVAIDHKYGRHALLIQVADDDAHANDEPLTGAVNPIDEDGAVDYVYHYRRMNSIEFVAHRTSTHNLRASRLHAYRSSRSLIHQSSSIFSSHSSERINQENVIRKWWTPSMDNLDMVQNISVSDQSNMQLVTHQTRCDGVNNNKHSGIGNKNLNPHNDEYIANTRPIDSIECMNITYATQQPPSAHQPPIPVTADSYGISIHPSDPTDMQLPITPPAATTTSVSCPVEVLVSCRSRSNMNGMQVATDASYIDPNERKDAQEIDGASDQSNQDAHASDRNQQTHSLHAIFSYHLSNIQALPIEFWLIMLIMLLFYGCTSPFIIILSDDLQNWSIFLGDSQRAGWLLAVPDMLSTLLVPALGAFTDRCGRRIVIVFLCGIGLAAVHAAFAIPDISTVYGLIILGLARIFAVILLGIVYAFYVCVFWPWIAFIVPYNARETAYAVATALLNVNLVVIPFVVARITVVNDAPNDTIADYTTVHYLFGAMALLGALIVCPILFGVDMLRNNGILNMRGVFERQHHRYIGGSGHDSTVQYTNVNTHSRIPTQNAQDTSQHRLSNQPDQIIEAQQSTKPHAVSHRSFDMDLTNTDIDASMDSSQRYDATSQPFLLPLIYQMDASAAAHTIHSRASGTLRWIVHGAMYDTIPIKDNTDAVQDVCLDTTRRSCDISGWPRPIQSDHNLVCTGANNSRH